MSIAFLTVLGLATVAGACLAVDGVLRLFGRGEAAEPAAVPAHSADASLRMAEPAGTWLGRRMQLLLQ